MLFSIFCTKCETKSHIHINHNSKYLKCPKCSYTVNLEHLLKTALKINKIFKNHPYIYYYLRAELEQDFLLSYSKRPTPKTQFDFFISRYKKATDDDKELINPRMDIVGIIVEYSKYIPYRVLYHHECFSPKYYAYGLKLVDFFSFKYALQNKAEHHHLIPLINDYNQLYQAYYPLQTIWMYPTFPSD